LKISKKKALIRKFLTKKQEATGSWRNIYNENIHKFLLHQSIMRNPFSKSHYVTDEKNSKSGG